jgi:hypothetical protein
MHAAARHSAQNFSNPPENRGISEFFAVAARFLFCLLHGMWQIADIRGGLSA